MADWNGSAASQVIARDSNGCLLELLVDQTECFDAPGEAAFPRHALRAASAPQAFELARKLRQAHSAVWVLPALLEEPETANRPLYQVQALKNQRYGRVDGQKKETQTGKPQHDRQDHVLTSSSSGMSSIYGDKLRGSRLAFCKSSTQIKTLSIKIDSYAAFAP